MTDAQTKLELRRLRGLSDTEVIHEAEDTPIGQHPIVIVLIERFKVRNPERIICPDCRGSGDSGAGRARCERCAGGGWDLS